jgi:O-antigen/teichoic acid export membrane protein
MKYCSAAFFCRLKSSAFFKNFLVIMSGTAIAQLIGFALTPVISRFFDPADFGVFGSFTSVLCVVGAGVTLQYSQALMLPKDDSEAANVFAVSMISVLFFTLCAILAVCLFPKTFLSLFKAPACTWLLWLFPVGVLLNGINQTLQAWCVRRKAFTLTSISPVVRAVSGNTVQILLGVLKTGGAGRTAGAVMADGVASINLANLVFRKDWSFIRPSLDLGKIKQAARKYCDFPMYAATQNTMNALSQGLPVLLLGYYFGAAVAGAYAFGIRLLQVPMNFVLNALRQVLFQKATEIYNHGGKLYPLYIKITGGLFAAAFFPALVLFIWSPELFAWVFGQKWYVAGEYASWLVIWLAVLFCNLPSNLFARIIRQQRNLFLFELLALVLRSSVLAVGGYYWVAKTTVIVFSILGCLLNIVFILWIGGVLRYKEQCLHRKELVDE